MCRDLVNVDVRMRAGREVEVLVSFGFTKFELFRL